MYNRIRIGPAPRMILVGAFMTAALALCEWTVTVGRAAVKATSGEGARVGRLHQPVHF